MNIELDCLNRKTLPKLFEEVVFQNPDRIALIFEGESLTYKELNNRANQLAHYLVKNGIKSDSFVAICLDRSIHMVIGMLGVLKAGGAYVPIDSEYPEERVKYMLQDVEASIILSSIQQRQFLEKIKIKGKNIIYLDQDWNKTKKESDKNIKTEPKSNHLAYIIYTSGSTGKPKGVMIEHRSLMNLFFAMQKVLKVDIRDEVLAVTPISFDISIMEIFFPLLKGGRVIICSRTVSLDGSVLAEYLEQCKITMMQATPATWNMLCEAKWKNNRNIKILSTGEALESKLATRLIKLSTEVWNLYGPTEATIWATIFNVTRDSIKNGPYVPIGSPISGVKVYIINNRMMEVKKGEAGELYIGGLCLSRGYLNQDKLTKEKFVENPFLAKEERRKKIEKGEDVRLYKTGDLVRYLKDGNIEFIKRIDNQVKVRGYRIELEEIEFHLSKHRSVSQSIVVVSEGCHGEKQIVAYVILNKRKENSNESLRNHKNYIKGFKSYLEEHIPSYMIPDFFIFLKKPPLTPSGKVDRNSLSNNKIIMREKKSCISPSTEMETLLLSAIQDFLKTQICIKDNFLMLGLNSLSLSRLSSRINHVLALNIPLKHFYDFPSIFQLARRLKKTKENNKFIPVIQQDSKNKKFPVTFSQQMVFNLSHGNALAVCFAVQIKGNLKEGLFRCSLRELVKHHASLRTTYAMRTEGSGFSYQMISSQNDLCFKKYDISRLYGKENKAKKIISMALLEPFNLEAGPLWRFMLFKLDKEEQIFSFVAHHSVADGVSLNLAWEYIKSYYNSFLVNQPITVSAVYQYTDYADWQRRFCTSCIRKESISYWKKKLIDVNQEDLFCLDYSRPKKRPIMHKSLTAQHHFEISEKDAMPFIEMAKKNNSSLFMALLSVLYILVFKHSRQTDITISSTSANRARIEFEKTIGSFFVYLFYRIKLNNNMTFLEILRETRNIVLEANKYQDYPFKELMEELDSIQSSKLTSIWQASFTFISASDLAITTLPMSGIKLTPISPMEMGGVIPQIRDLHLFILEKNNVLNGVFLYQRNLFKLSSIKNLGENFKKLLNAIVRYPERNLMKLLKNIA